MTTLKGTRANDPAALRIAADFLEENGFDEEAKALSLRADYLDRDNITDGDERYRLYIEMNAFPLYGEETKRERPERNRTLRDEVRLVPY